MARFTWPKQADELALSIKLAEWLLQLEGRVDSQFDLQMTPADELGIRKALFSTNHNGFGFCELLVLEDDFVGAGAATTEGTPAEGAEPVAQPPKKATRRARPSPRKRVSDDELIEALLAHPGRMKDVAAQLGVSTDTVSRREKDLPVRAGWRSALHARYAADFSLTKKLYEALKPTLPGMTLEDAASTVREWADEARPQALEAFLAVAAQQGVYSAWTTRLEGADQAAEQVARHHIEQRLAEVIRSGMP